jgi:hypothetical protein
MDNKTLAAYLDRIAVARPGVLDEAGMLSSPQPLTRFAALLTRHITHHG